MIHESGIALCCLLAAAAAKQPSADLRTNDASVLNFEPGDRVLVFAPHPDDESIACGGVIQRAIAAGASVRVVFLTYGDSNELSFMLRKKHPVLNPTSVRRMGLIRHDEAVAAGAELGLGTNTLAFLGYPDFGTMDIWYARWGKERPPLRSILTQADHVPYDNAYRPGASYKAEEVLRDLKTSLLQFRPTKVFVSHPADRNTDHRALYLFTQVALWDLENEMKPAVYPYLVHFRNWPRKKGFLPGETMTFPALLSNQVAWSCLALSSAEIGRKKTAIKAHATQCGYSANFLLSFARQHELFGDFPRIVLSAAATFPDHARNPPHEPAGNDCVEDELTEEERSLFTGVQWRTVQWNGKDLLISVQLSRPIADAVSASIYAFGYRADCPFEKMPKLNIRVRPLTHEILDQNRKLPDQTVALERGNKTIFIRIPAAAIGNPQRVLISVRTYLADVPLDSVAWRTLEFSPAQK